MEIIHVIQRKVGISNVWLDTVDGPKIPATQLIYV